MSVILDAIQKAMGNEPVPSMTPEEAAWWMETRKHIRRRQLYASAAKAGLVMVIVALVKMPRWLASSGLLLGLSAGLAIFALLTALFMWQGRAELESERKKRLIARRTNEAILKEGDAE